MVACFSLKHVGRVKRRQAAWGKTQMSDYMVVISG
jgi:hypothetical protein